MTKIYKSFEEWFESKNFSYARYYVHMEESWNARQMEIDELRAEIESLKDELKDLEFQIINASN